MAAAGLLLFQTALNIFGITDVLPLTGVTLPFVSQGGSSMISCWAVLAFIKASRCADIQLSGRCAQEMKMITKRGIFLWILAVAFLFGLGFMTYSLVENGDTWVMKTYNTHIYKNGDLIGARHHQVCGRRGVGRDPGRQAGVC